MEKFLLVVASYNCSVDFESLGRCSELVDILIVNQYTYENGLILSAPFGVEFENHKEKGLSKSRNRGLDAAHDRHLIIADDDLIYNLEQLKKFIVAAESEFRSGYGFLTFNNDHDTGPIRNLHDHTEFSVFKVPSWTICVSKAALGFCIRFDERFGINGVYNSGEENIYLYDLLRKGVRGKHLPFSPVRHVDISTGFVWNSQLAKTKGALFLRTFGGVKGFILLVVFMCKKLPEYRFNFKLFFVALNEFIRCSSAGGFDAC